MQKATDVTDAELLDVFAFPASESLTVRATMISSVDGAATVAHRSGMLGGDGDHLVFHSARLLADAIVVGARTAVLEGYRAPCLDADHARRRRQAGQAPSPTLVLASRTLDIPADYEPVTASNVVVATCGSAPDKERRRLLDRGATVIDCGDDEVDPARLVAELDARGFRRIDLEGGPTLIAAFTVAGLLDELLLTVSPTLVSGDAPRIAAGAALPIRDQGLPMPGRLPYPLRLARMVGDDDGFLYQLWQAVRA